MADEKGDNEEIVKISKGDLRNLLSDVEQEFEKKLEERDKKIAILTEASDITRLSKVIAGKEGTGPRQHTMKVGTYNDLVIVGWEQVMDVVEKQNNIWIEKQIQRIILEDGKTVEMPYEEFHRKLYAKQIVCDVLARTVDADGNTVVKLKRQDNGKVYDLDIAFVN